MSRRLRMRKLMFEQRTQVASLAGGNRCDRDFACAGSILVCFTENYTAIILSTIRSLPGNCWPSSANRKCHNTSSECGVLGRLSERHASFNTHFRVQFTTLAGIIPWRHCCQRPGEANFNASADWALSSLRLPLSVPAVGIVPSPLFIAWRRVSKTLVNHAINAFQEGN